MARSDSSHVRKQFHSLYHADCRVFRAPGRVNLIGEHTDYNDGFVMPAAIEFFVWVAIAPRKDTKLQVHSVNYSETVTIDLEEANPEPRRHWSDYIHGVALMLQRAGYRLPGANILLRGNVAIGSGLSSSAAVEVATGLALLENADTTVDRVELAKLCQHAENEFVGARVGIMDQFVSCCGRAGQALLLDCRSLESRPLAISSDATLVICNTMVKHQLAGSAYNTRRAECEEGVHILSQFLPSIHALRDVSQPDLEQHSRKLPENIYKRCKHVITENCRVTQAAAALDCGDLALFGRLMGESHRSLRDDYEVSCAELDQMVHVAAQAEGVIGSRMTGGGFGGCTINLVKSEHVTQFKRHVAAAYERATGRVPQIFTSAAANGASEIRFDRFTS